MLIQFSMQFSASSCAYLPYLYLKSFWSLMFLCHPEVLLVLQKGRSLYMYTIMSDVSHQPKHCSSGNPSLSSPPFTCLISIVVTSAIVQLFLHFNKSFLLFHFFIVKSSLSHIENLSSYNKDPGKKQHFTWTPCI